MTHSLLALLAGLGPTALLVLVAVAFAETGLLVGFLVPGDTVVFGGGVLLASGVLHLALWPTMLAVALAAGAGDQVAYLVGRRAGPWLLQRREGRRLRLGLSRRHLEYAAGFFARHGPRAVVLARFVPLARTMTPVVAGLGRMPRGRFTAYNAVGAVAWTVLTLGGGYWFGTIPFVAAHLVALAVLVAIASLTPVVVPLGLQRWRAHRAGTGKAHLPNSAERDCTAYADPTGAPMTELSRAVPSPGTLP